MTEPEQAPLPAAFIGHGTPMNALDHNRYTDAWQAFGESVATPRAILSVSAHWYINASAVTAMSDPRTIHDFYGFPDELFAVQYPAPGSPEVAEEVAELVRPTWVGQDNDSWGIDHGTWSVLVHTHPAAAVPVVQLSINAQKPFEYHLDLGARLAPLAERGILVLGSGNVVHNLRRLDWGRVDGGYDWAHRFDDHVRTVLHTDPASLPGVVSHPDYELAVPTPDHFIPMLYVAGFAAATGREVHALVDGCAMGSLSMTSYGVGCSVPATTRAAGAPALPDGPDGPRGEDTNI